MDDNRTGGAWRWQRYLVAVDILIAVPVILLVGAATGPEATLDFTGPRWLGWLVAVVLGAPVAVRRRWPLPAFLVTCAGLLGATFMSMPWGPSALAFVLSPSIVLYSVGRGVRSRTSVIALSTYLVGVTVSVWILAYPKGWKLSDLAILIGIVFLVSVAAWAIGRAGRVRDQYFARSAAQQVSAAVAQERLRIAREMHDIVAHSMSLIAVKAGVAGLAAPQRPEAATEALQVISQVSRSSLRDMRRLLGALRSDMDDAEVGELAPVPGIADLSALVAQASQAGVEVVLGIDADLALPEDLSLAVYRIVQESVTNVVKHAGVAGCRVEVSARQGAIHVTVIDDGIGQRQGPHRIGDGSGHGLIGMRERVAVHGGRFSAGTRPGGGFAVTAVLPMENTAVAA